MQQKNRFFKVGKLELPLKDVVSCSGPFRKLILGFFVYKKKIESFQFFTCFYLHCKL